jgi:hypothetical protein
MNHTFRAVFYLLSITTTLANIQAQDAYMPCIPIEYGMQTDASPNGSILIGHDLNYIYYCESGKPNFEHLKVSFPEKDSLNNSHYIQQIIWINNDSVYIFINGTFNNSIQSSGLVLLSTDRCKNFKLVSILPSNINYAQFLDNNELYLALEYMNFFVSADFGETWYQEITESPAHNQNTILFNFSNSKRKGINFSSTGLYVNNKAHLKYVPWKTIEHWEQIPIPISYAPNKHAFEQKTDLLAISSSNILIRTSGSIFYSNTKAKEWKLIDSASFFVQNYDETYYILTDSNSIYWYDATLTNTFKTAYRSTGNISSAFSKSNQCYVITSDSVFIVDIHKILAKPFLISNESIILYSDTITFHDNQFQWDVDYIYKFDKLQNRYYRYFQPPFPINQIYFDNNQLIVTDYYENWYTYEPENNSIVKYQPRAIHLQTASLRDTMSLEFLYQQIDNSLRSDVVYYVLEKDKYIRNSPLINHNLIKRYFKDTILVSDIQELFDVIAETNFQEITLSNLGLKAIDFTNFSESFERNDSILKTLFNEAPKTLQEHVDLNHLSISEINKYLLILQQLNGPELLKLLRYPYMTFNDMQFISTNFKTPSNEVISLNTGIGDNLWKTLNMSFFYQRNQFNYYNVVVYKHFESTFATTNTALNESYKNRLIIRLLLAYMLQQ